MLIVLTEVTFSLDLDFDEVVNILFCPLILPPPSLHTPISLCDVCAAVASGGSCISLFLRMTCAHEDSDGTGGGSWWWGGQTTRSISGQDKRSAVISCGQLWSPGQVLTTISTMACHVSGSGWRRHVTVTHVSLLHRPPPPHRRTCKGWRDEGGGWTRTGSGTARQLDQHRQGHVRAGIHAQGNESLTMR